MPDHFVYVAVAYGLWLGAFALYLIHLLRRSRRASQALSRLSGPARQDPTP